jgi:hypothetical protein
MGTKYGSFQCIFIDSICHDSGPFKTVANCLIKASLDLGEYFSLGERPGSGFLVTFINC